MQHASLDLSQTTLSRIGAAGINFGLSSTACKLKFYDLELNVGSQTLRSMQQARVALVLHHLRSMIEE